MASVHDYTSMPWAVRSSNSSSAATSSSATAAEVLNTATLIQQLAESHATNRELERRIADLHVDHAKNVQEVTRSLEQKAGDLLREVQQAQTREKAVRGVFIRNYEKEQEWGLKMREMEEKLVFYDKEQELDLKNREVEERMSQLEHREMKMKEVEQEYMIKEMELEESKSEFFLKWGSCGAREITSREEATEPNKDMWEHAQRFLSVLVGGDSFKLKDSSKFEKYDLSISFDDMNGDDIQLLRRHDYYKGWLDCARAMGQEESVNQGIITSSMVPHLYEISHPKCPKAAGIQAGVLFMWAALSQQHKPEWNVRLDDRSFNLRNLAIPRYHKEKLFWKGFAFGEDAVRKDFWERMVVSNEDSIEE